jgi:hypothetical protein
MRNDSLNDVNFYGIYDYYYHTDFNKSKMTPVLPCSICLILFIATESNLIAIKKTPFSSDSAEEVSFDCVATYMVTYATYGVLF